MIQKLSQPASQSTGPAQRDSQFACFRSGSLHERHPDLPSLDFQFEWVSDAGRLEQIQAQWHRLIETSIEPNYFYHPELLIPAIEHFETGRVGVLLVWARPRVNPDADQVSLRSVSTGVPAQASGPVPVLGP